MNPDVMTSRPESAPVRKQYQNIPLYWPNLIGYLRIITLFLAVFTFSRNAWRAGAWYAVSELLDAADGHVARALNQASLYGAVLDQVTDRLSTVAIYMMLCTRFPNLAPFIFLLVVADVGGHWVYVHSQTLRNARSHKEVPVSWPVLRFYYTNKVVMFVCHFCYEVALCGSLVASFCEAGSTGQKLAQTLVYISVPLGAFKAFTNAAQLILGGQLLCELESSPTQSQATTPSKKD